MNAIPKPVREPKAKRYIPRSNAGGRLIARAERACSRLARERVGGHCEICGGRGTEAAHIFGKGAHPNVRFDGRNLVWACHECHMRGHREPHWWMRMVAVLLGEIQLNALSLRATVGQMDDPRLVLAAASAGRFLIERQP